MGFSRNMGARSRGGQTILLAAMNATALLRARNFISDPVGMLLQNCVFLIFAWIAAGQLDCYAAAA
jgi:hypothetical protein